MSACKRHAQVVEQRRPIALLVLWHKMPLKREPDKRLPELLDLVHHSLTG
jgi:hypothetical protein